jgi:tRNA U34 5-carboxymethylaminomethyl modifying GTPase MnmE/TrmE
MESGKASDNRERQLRPSHTQILPVDLDKLKTAQSMIRAARISAKRVALKEAVGTLSTAFNLIKEVIMENAEPTQGDKDFFWTDIEQMAHGFLCAILANPSMLNLVNEMDTSRMIHDSVQMALDLRGHILEVRKELTDHEPV